MKITSKIGEFNVATGGAGKEREMRVCDLNGMNSRIQMRLQLSVNTVSALPL